MMNDKETVELMKLAEAEVSYERLVDMNQAMEMTTLSRRTILDMEKRGEFPERRRISEGRYAWHLSDIVKWINNIPLKSDFYLVERPEVTEHLRLKIERGQAHGRAGKSRLVG